MKNPLKKIPFVVLFCLIIGCSPNVPEDFGDSPLPPLIYPDYAGVTIPPNIAPINFEIQVEGENFFTTISGKNGKPVSVSGKQVVIPETLWRDLLEENRGEEIQFEICVQNNSLWTRHAPIVNRVAEEPIDDWITYRLIEPGYERYLDIEIHHRNLSSFEVRPFYDNNLSSKQQCANCHSFQNWHTSRMLLHTRRHKSGTIFIQDGKAEKIDLSTDETISAGVYPSWHPTLNLVAFSLNTTGQIFHTVSKAKIEVLDSASDLALYDVDANELTHILKSDDQLETYPTWSLDGNWLYYCSAEKIFNEEISIPESSHEYSLLDAKQSATVKNYDKIHYNLMRMSFNRETKRFGEPELVVDAVSQDKSVTFPRLSPDGRYIMYTLSNFGTFSIWHKESDLWLHNLETGENNPLTEANSDQADSFHNWSSNGRWFVFTSRRDDGAYTRLYFAYFDKNGNTSKPFLLPQKTPFHNIELMKSYNVPELTVEPIQIGNREMYRTINCEPKRTTYRRN